MSDVDISAEAVERLARQHDLSRFTMGMRAPEHDNTAATLRALRAALDAAETDLAIARADLDNSGATSLEIAAERDAALAARDAAWRAGRDAAAVAAIEDGNFGDYQRHELTADFGQPRFDMMQSIVRAIRTLQPPADLAAEAPGDAVAKEREAWQPLYEAAQNLAASLDGGFVACSHCGEQEATGDMDFVPEFLAAIRARAGA